MNGWVWVFSSLRRMRWSYKDSDALAEHSLHYMLKQKASRGYDRSSRKRLWWYPLCFRLLTTNKSGLQRRGVASLAAELDEMKLWRSKFYNVALSFLPRSNNFCADSFAKEGRSRVQCFSFINSLVLFWPAPEARLNEPVWF